VQRGLEAANRGDEHTARTLWQQAADQGHPTARFNLAVMEYDSGRYREAIALWQPLAQGPDPDPLIRIAESFRKLGQEAEALDWFRKAAHLGSASAMYELGLDASTHGRRDEAIGWYEAAMDRGSDPWAAVNLGTLFIGEGDIPRARTIFERAQDWGDPEVLFYLGQTQELMGESAPAAATYRRASEMGHLEAKERLAKLPMRVSDVSLTDSVSARAKYCSACGTQRSGEAKFCPECGAQFDSL